MSKDEERKFSGVRAKLDAYRKENSGIYEKQLPKSGITVQIPEFINHGMWMKAQRQAGSDIPKAQTAYVIEAVTFEREKLTMADIQEGLICAPDMLFLTGEVFKDDPDDPNGKKDAGK